MSYQLSVYQNWKLLSTASAVCENTRMHEHYFSARGICYRVNDFQPDRQTLVWIHGLSGSASAWFPYEKLFGNKYNLLTLDLRGHGRSARPSHYEDYSLPECAEDLHELLAYLHIENCIVASHSLGALVALEYMSKHKEKVSAMIFLSPSSLLKQTKWFPFVRNINKALIALLRLFPFRSSMRGRVDYSIFTYTSDWDPRRIFRDVYITTLHSYFYCLAQSYAKDYDEQWKYISVPTLIIHGTRDTYIPVQHSMRLEKEIRGSKLVLLEGANHIIVINNIPEVAEHIKSFLSAQ